MFGEVELGEFPGDVLAGRLGRDVLVDRAVRLLREMGCEFAQGYLFARPLPEDEVLSQLT